MVRLDFISHTGQYVAFYKIHTSSVQCLYIRAYLLVLWFTHSATISFEPVRFHFQTGVTALPKWWPRTSQHTTFQFPRNNNRLRQQSNTGLPIQLMAHGMWHSIPQRATHGGSSFINLPADSLGGGGNKRVKKCGHYLYKDRKSRSTYSSSG